MVHRPPAGSYSRAPKWTRFVCVQAAREAEWLETGAGVERDVTELIAVYPLRYLATAIEALAASGRLGALRFARTAFTGVLDRHDDHRWRPEMAGGALLDLGIYCVAPLLALAGRPPVRVEAAAARAPSGVDASFSGWLDSARACRAGHLGDASFRRRPSAGDHRVAYDRLLQPPG